LPAQEDLSPYHDLKTRDASGQGVFVVEGRHLVERMLASPCRPCSVLCVPADAEHFSALAAGRCPVIVREPGEISGIAGFDFHRGVLGCGFRPDPVPPAALTAGHGGEGRALLVVCPDLNDDANLGSVLRSAVAFRAAGVLLGPRACDPFSRRALRLSMGASLFARISRAREDDEALAALRSGSFAVYGAANRPDALDLEELRPAERAAIVIGNEGSGLDGRWLGGCDALVRIPMGDALDSLNAGVAAGILLYRLTRARRP
jgi:tRNA G18 (ribose-2'-O)-methylase SpoU